MECGLWIENFNIMNVHWKIQFLAGGWLTSFKGCTTVTGTVLPENT